MTKKKFKLTEAEVEAATYDPAGPNVQRVWDTETTGFGLRLYPSGKKSFIVGYRTSGKPRMSFAVIGKVGQMKAKQARNEAQKILANERDPIQEDRDAKAEVAKKMLEQTRNPTITVLIDSYYAHHEKRQRNAEKAGSGRHLSKATLQQYRWTIEKYIRPYLSDWRVRDLKRGDIRAYIRDLTDQQKYSNYVANNILQRLKGLMRFALDEEYIEQNPCADVTTDYEYIPKDRTLTEKEIRVFWFGLENTSISKPVQLALKLLLVTAQRRSEIVEARWEWVDWEYKTLTIPRQNVKNRKGANVVPLSHLAIALLEELKSYSAGSPFIVPSQQKWNSHTAPQTVTNRLRENIDKLGADLATSFTPHDLRRTVATMLSSEEVQREHIKAVLNHAFGDVTESYINSSYINQKRRYLDLWATKLETILDSDRRGSNVVVIDKRK